MDQYISEVYNWMPKGLLFVSLIYLTRRLANNIHDDIMNALDELKKSMAAVTGKLEVFDSKINDINLKINAAVTMDRYITENEKIWRELHHIKERSIMLEHIVNLEKKREQDR
jgi:hypothetical protein